MDLFSEIILDYYKHPRNKGPLNDATHFAEEDNPLCGDKIRIDLKIVNNTIAEAKFSGQGCAISQAATSMLTEKLIGKTLPESKLLTAKDVVEMLGIPISPGRIKCATLGLIAFQKALTVKS